MNIKIYESYKPIATFYKINQNIYYEYKDKIEIANEENIKNLKENLQVPYKLLFKGIPLEIMTDILEFLKDIDNDMFFYRIRDNKNNLVNYHAIITESQKIKTK